MMPGNVLHSVLSSNVCCNEDEKVADIQHCFWLQFQEECLSCFFMFQWWQSFKNDSEPEMNMLHAACPAMAVDQGLVSFTSLDHLRSQRFNTNEEEVMEAA
jgi:hypothetical protein